MMTHRRRLERIEETFRLDPALPLWEQEPALWAAMTPADRAVWDRIAQPLRVPIDRLPHPETPVDPDDYAKLAGIMASTLRRLGRDIVEARVAATVGKYRADYARDRMNGEQND